jgi:hypothetical protein
MDSQASTPTEILSCCQPLGRVETWRHVLQKNLAKVCRDDILSIVLRSAIYIHFELEFSSKTMENVIMLQIPGEDDEGKRLERSRPLTTTTATAKEEFVPKKTKMHQVKISVAW